MTDSAIQKAASELPEPPETLLTPAAIQRVREGVEIARAPIVRKFIDQDLKELSAIADGTADHRVSGRFRRWVMRRFIKTFFRVRIENTQYIPTEPNVLAANHLGHVDPFLILAFVPPHPYYYILGDARTLYNKCWKRWLVGWAGGVIPLERWWKEEIAVMAAAETGRDDLKDLATEIKHDVPNGSSIHQMRQIDQAVQALLARGDGIMLFPEGRLGHQEAQMQFPLKRGTVIYAMRSGVPITPVFIIGTQDLYWRKRLTLRFGPPVHLPQQQRPKRLDIDAALEQVEQAFKELMPSDYQEPQGPKLFRYWLNHLFW
ncbi:lysophospholipid acyltransferase family protein [Nodosilinea sp. P-1105]|uniref:lysophospholipid acyltransferase family protein n=1 Tax=Nodosilinea sp. P-1105 TaxID=2546229 RepID=UPI00146E4CB1|nr:lysophospholipid acyltransferase family protein [Nodosilinea sp. P-1105]NMF82681.1 1-acyl-sn-glycerol-3-phosphate acyltransferase [Nodosilinea sp. P-1105]